MPLAAAALGVCAGPPAGAQVLVPVGTEFQVNSYTSNAQIEPSVAAGPQGSFVVVWQSNGSSGGDTSSNSVQGQRYASDGSIQGVQFQVNTYTTGAQGYPSVASDADGDFAVVWQSSGSSGGDTSSTSIQGQRYASDGSSQGAQFQVNTYTTSFQSRPSVAMRDIGGTFVVVWQSNGSSGGDTSNYSVRGRRFASDGSALGSEFQVNSYTTNAQSMPSVGMDDFGFVVAWQSDGSDGTDADGYGIQAQRYFFGGGALGAQFQVNTYTTSHQRRPVVGGDGAAEFAVVWESNGSSGTDTSGYSIQGQHFLFGGSNGAEFQVNTYTTDGQNDPSVAMGDSGEFVVVWHSVGSFGTDALSHSIQSQRYASDGSVVGPPFQVNTYTTSSQQFPSVALEGEEFAVVWTSTGSSGTDTSSRSIQGQRYTVPFKVPSLSPGSAAAAALLMLGAVAIALRRRA